MTNSTEPQKFDERSALAELEQLADKIQLSRRQREQAVAEFDDFVRKFREDRYNASIAASRDEAALYDEHRANDRRTAVNAATHASHAIAPGAPVVNAAAPAPLVRPGSDSEVVPWAIAAPPESMAQPVEEPRTRPRAAHVGVGLAALAVVAVGVLLWRSTTAPVGPAARPVTPPASTAPSAPGRAAPSTQGPVTAPAAPAAVAGPPRALNLELITVRPVWARVTVDGRRAVERELPAGQKMPFGADSAIAIRAGDAGAIRLVVDGKDLGALGRDGQVYNRTFTAPAPR